MIKNLDQKNATTMSSGSNFDNPSIKTNYGKIQSQLIILICLVNFLGRNLRIASIWFTNDFSIKATANFNFFYPLYRKPHILDFVIALQKI